MRYSFSKKQIIKNSILAYIYSLICTTFLLICVSELYYKLALEFLACQAISVSVAIFYAVCAYSRRSRKTFSIDEQGIIFYIKNKEVKRIEHSELIETYISKSIFKGNRIINLTTQSGTISFAVNYRVYQRIRHFFPIFNDQKEKGIIEFTNKYMLKTLAMRVTVIVFLFALATLIFSPILLGLLYKASDHFKQAKKVYFIFLVASVSALLVAYVIYFFVKFFMYKRHSIRYDGTLKVEYYKFGKQKNNLEIKTIQAVREVRSVFSKIFGLVQVYLIHKNADGLIVNDLIPFCLTQEDANKLKSLIFTEQPTLKKAKKSCYGFCVFPIILMTALTVFLSVLFTPWFLFGLLAVALYYLFYIKNREWGLGEKVFSFSCGTFSKTVYTFKSEFIKGVGVSQRFFETRLPYAYYEILTEGENGVYLLGPYEKDLAEKIKEKLKDN